MMKMDLINSVVVEICVVDEVKVRKDNRRIRLQLKQNILKDSHEIIEQETKYLLGV